MRHRSRVVVLLASAAIAGLLTSYVVHAPHEIPAPPQPSGLVAYHSPLSFVKQIEHDPDAGRKIFNEFCSSCHAEKPLIDVHAPRLKDVAAWRAVRQKNQPASRLSITREGSGAMPARGGCFECSDKQLQQAIDYMSKEAHTDEASLSGR